MRQFVLVFIERAPACDPLDPDGKLSVCSGCARLDEHVGRVFMPGALEVGAIDEEPRPQLAQLGPRGRFLFQDGVRFRIAPKRSERLGFQQREIPVPGRRLIVPTRGARLCFLQRRGGIPVLVRGDSVLIRGLRPLTRNGEANDREERKPLK